MAKLNCWEFTRCGKEHGGAKAAEGICPAALDDVGQGVNGGECCGRLCWSVPGTLCGSGRQGAFAEKREGCERCDFFRLVAREEGISFQSLPRDQSQAW